MAILNYAQLADVKTYLWITGTASDAQLNMLLTQSYYYINNLLGVDTLNQWTMSETLDRVFDDGSFWVKNLNSTALLTIDWESYTGVLNTDYQITRWRKFTVKDISNYMWSLEFYSLPITYTAWWDRDETWTTPWANDTLPYDIILAQMMIVWQMKSTADAGGVGLAGWVTSYKLGEESINYWGSNSSAENKTGANVWFDVNSIRGVLSKYLKWDVYSV